MRKGRVPKKNTVKVVPKETYDAFEEDFDEHTNRSVPRSCGTPLAGHVCEPDQQVQSRVQGMVCECGSLIHLVLDVPDMDYLYSLETREKLLTLDNLETVFHFSPHEVVTGLKQWPEMLRDNVSHIMLNECTS